MAALGLAVMRVAEGADVADPAAASAGILAPRPGAAPFAAAEGETLVSARVSVDGRGGLIFPGDDVMVFAHTSGEKVPLGPLTVVAIERRAGLERPALMTFSVSRSLSKELRTLREEGLLSAKLHRLSVRGDAYGLAQLPEAQVITRRYADEGDERPGL